MSSKTNTFSDVNEIRELKDEKQVKKINNNYSLKYRIFKTLLMTVAWISLGINIEIVKTALEDLKILLNTDYQQTSFSLVIRSGGYMLNIIFAALAADKYLKYSETIMVLGKFLIILPNFLVPWIRTYWISMSLFLIQGIGFGIFDSCGNQIMFRLWNDISTSPLNAMHAGYGVGAMLSIQIVKNYIKFKPLYNNSHSNQQKTSFNNQTIASISQVTAADINLYLPFTVAGLVGLLVLIFFIIAQCYETKNIEKNERSKLVFDQNEIDLDSETFDQITDIPLPSVQKLLFKDKLYKSKQFVFILLLIFLLNLLLFNIASYLAVSSMFMLTYLSIGPAGFILKNCFLLQTLFWLSFICGRIIAVFLAFKMNPLVYGFFLLLLNVIVAGLYTLPYVNTVQYSYWFILTALGVLNGPLVPSVFMTAKHVLVSVNAFVVSLFCIGSGLGQIISQNLAARILDKFEPNEGWLGYDKPTSKYTIPLILLIYMSSCFAIYVVLLIIYKRFKRVLKVN